MQQCSKGLSILLCDLHRIQQNRMSNIGSRENASTHASVQRMIDEAAYQFYQVTTAFQEYLAIGFEYCPPPDMAFGGDEGDAVPAQQSTSDQDLPSVVKV